MKLPVIVGVYFAGLLSTGLHAADWKISGRLSSDLQTIDLVGIRDEAREGATHNEELALNLAGPLGQGESGIETRMRATNDRRIQQDGAELLSLYSYYKDKVWTVEAGDVAASLNPYIFSGSLKGFKSVYKAPEPIHAWSYTVVAGLKKDLWREFYSDDVDESPTAYAAALEARYVHEKGKTVSLSLAGVNHNLSSVPQNVAATGSRGLALGVEGGWRFSRSVTLEGRGALTRGIEDIKAGSPEASHNAVLLKLLTKPQVSVKSNFTYQRVSPRFVAFGGSAARDKEQLENTTLWDIDKSMRATFDLKASRDNLGNVQGATQKLFYESAQLVYYPSFIKKGDITFQISNKDIHGRGADNTRVTTGVDLNVRENKSWRYGVGFDYSDQEDHVAPAASEIAHVYKALLGYKGVFGDDRSYRLTWTGNYQDIENKEAKVGFKFDAGYTHSKRLSLDFFYMNNMSNRADASDSTSSTYQLRGSYLLDKKGASVLRVLLEKQALDLSDPATGNTIEYTGKISLSTNF